MSTALVPQSVLFASLIVSAVEATHDSATPEIQGEIVRELSAIGVLTQLWCNRGSCDTLAGIDDSEERCQGRGIVVVPCLLKFFSKHEKLLA